MGIRRFVGPNGRETMAQVRRELGVDALVLATRKLTGGRIEVMAAAPDEVETMLELARPHVGPAARVHPAGSDARAESFEDFLRRQAGKQQRAVAAAAPAFEQPAAAAEPAIAAAPQSPAVLRRRNASPEREPNAAPAPAVGPQADAKVLEELQSMRALLLEQMATIGAAGGAAEQRSPVQLRVTTRLLSAGFSPEVARQIAARAPAAAAPGEIEGWLHDVLALNVRCVSAETELLARGGVFALVGPTGVGKTTTVAKLAARFAVRHGAQALGLITLDAFRVGAHEQLRTYGRILGTPVHLAQDAATLRELLASMSGRKLVLVDTCGVSQRDERLAEVRALLAQAGAQRPIEPVLLVNAASHAETLDDVARAWQADGCAAIVTKLDEATRLGGALDCVLRHKLVVAGATNGQRVPEDWLAADSRLLAASALKRAAAEFALQESEATALVS